MRANILTEPIVAEIGSERAPFVIRVFPPYRGHSSIHAGDADSQAGDPSGMRVPGPPHFYAPDHPTAAVLARPYLPAALRQCIRDPLYLRAASRNRGRIARLHAIEARP